MSMLVLTLITGVGLGALYFLVASGLSLIYGLMHVLNFAHGAFLTLSAFVGWAVAQALGTASWGSFLLSILVGALVGAAFATLTELVLIRPLYERHIEQVLVTVGLSFAAVALFEGIWGTDPINIAGPPWLAQTTEVLGRPHPEHLLGAHDRRGARARRPRALPAEDPLRHGDPRRRREPLDGHGARHRRAQSRSRSSSRSAAPRPASGASSRCTTRPSCRRTSARRS